MKDKINKDFYCSTAGMADCPDRGDCMTCLDCPDRHRKHPTPEQFKEEYGEEYPDDGAVYFWDNSGNWWVTDKSNALANTKDYNLRHGRRSYIVCACTPFGAPDKDWRP
jgi:hypothetical protein